MTCFKSKCVNICEARGNCNGGEKSNDDKTDRDNEISNGQKELPYIDLGCWVDTATDTVIPKLEEQDPILDGSYHERTDAINKCAEAAGKRGYTVFALQNGGLCLSSCDAEKTYNMHGRSQACQQDGKGGKLANQVYEQKLQST